MRKSSILMTVVLLLLFSCKKEASRSSEPKVSEPKNNGNCVKINCYYNVYDSTALGKGISIDSSIHAAFYSLPAYSGNSTFAGSVSVNTMALNVSASTDSVYAFYHHTNGINLHKMIWSIGGSGPVLPSTFTCSPIIPEYNGAMLLPDTLSKSSLNFVIDQVNNASGFVLQLFQNTLRTSNLAQPSPATITIPASDQAMASFIPGIPVDIHLALGNYSETTIDGRKYEVRTGRLFHKYVYLKP